MYKIELYIELYKIIIRIGDVKYSKKIIAKS